MIFFSRVQYIQFGNGKGDSLFLINILFRSGKMLFPFAQEIFKAPVCNVDGPGGLGFYQNDPPAPDRKSRSVLLPATRMLLRVTFVS